MSTTTIRVSREAHTLLAELSEQTNKPMSAVLTDALEVYYRTLFLQATNAAFERLRAEGGGADYDAEMRIWDSTLLDGLEDY